MLRRVLLLLLCCILPLQSLQADVGALSHVRFAAGELVSLSELHARDTHARHTHAPHHHLDVVQHLVHEEGSVESVDRMNDHLSDHCVCPIGCLLPSPSWAVHRVIARQVLPEWMPRPLPAPVLPGPQRPPHAAG